MSDWKQVNNKGGNSEAWKPEKEGEEVSGIYVDRRENVGPYNSTIHTLQKEDGTQAAIFGSAVLNDNFSKISFGDSVKVVYTGKTKNKAGTFSFKNFDIFVKPAGETTDQKSDDVEPEEIPF